GSAGWGEEEEGVCSGANWERGDLGARREEQLLYANRVQPSHPNPNLTQAKTKGNNVGLGVKYAEKQQRRFQPEKLREGRNIIGLQMGTNKFASQQGMTAYGTRRHLYDPKLGTDQPLDQATISLQMGTNKGASQVPPCPIAPRGCWVGKDKGRKEGERRGKGKG
ncbi:calponin-1-like, partial [Meleagris gallopavo]|uniref:calponin-1-like n=1 Tax=Meleagris gallopavo TaxID=9103 RepID=UPI00093975A6